MSPRGGKRVGSGRPKTIAHPIKTALWLDRDVLERAKIAALAEGKTISEVVRDALVRFAGGRRKPRPRRSEKSRQS
jgi:hypothetical protein